MKVCEKDGCNMTVQWEFMFWMFHLGHRIGTMVLYIMKQLLLCSSELFVQTAFDYPALTERAQCYSLTWQPLAFKFQANLRARAVLRCWILTLQRCTFELTPLWKSYQAVHCYCICFKCISRNVSKMQRFSWSLVHIIKSELLLCQFF